MHFILKQRNLFSFSIPCRRHQSSWWDERDDAVFWDTRSDTRERLPFGRDFWRLYWPDTGHKEICFGKKRLSRKGFPFLLSLGGVRKKQKKEVRWLRNQLTCGVYMCVLQNLFLFLKPLMEYKCENHEFNWQYAKKGFFASIKRKKITCKFLFLLHAQTKG